MQALCSTNINADALRSMPALDAEDVPPAGVISQAFAEGKRASSSQCAHESQLRGVAEVAYTVQVPLMALCSFVEPTWDD
jgi:hypothetical protein